MPLPGAAPRDTSSNSTAMRSSVMRSCKPVRTSIPTWPSWWSTRRRGAAASEPGLPQRYSTRAGRARVSGRTETSTPAVEFAKSLDLVSVRELLQLRRPLDAPQLPEIVVPEGVTIRTYRGPEDDSEILRVNNAAFSWHPEQGGWTQAEVDERTAEGWFDPAGLFMAFADTDPDTLLGFHWTKVHAPEGDDPELGEVYVVGIDPAAQGRGLGRVLTLAGMHYLRDRGLGTVLLYVEGDNTAALHTYERLGFDRFHVDMAYARAL